MNSRNRLLVGGSLILLIIVGGVVSVLNRRSSPTSATEESLSHATVDINLLGALTYKRKVKNSNLSAGNRILTIGDNPGSSHILFESEGQMVLVSSNSKKGLSVSDTNSLYIDVRDNISTLTTDKPKNLDDINAYLGINNHPDGEFIALAVEKGSTTLTLNGRMYGLLEGQSMVISDEGEVINRGRIVSGKPQVSIDIQPIGDEEYLRINTDISNLVTVGGRYLEYDKNLGIYSIAISDVSDNDVIRIIDPLGKSIEKSISKLITDNKVNAG
jgi:hypothetical protein